MPLLRNATKTIRIPRSDPIALGRAMIELALARLRLGADHSQHLLTVKAAWPVPRKRLLGNEAELVDQVAFVIPRVAQHVPWRADCLVQALAAERWLRRRGIGAQIIIGVKKDGATLNAHAWLQAGDCIVTGGEIAGYVPLTG